MNVHYKVELGNEERAVLEELVCGGGVFASQKWREDLLGLYFGQWIDCVISNWYTYSEFVFERTSFFDCSWR